MKQPEEDPQLENMQQLELALARLLLNLCLHLKIIVAVPQPAVHLDQHGRAQEKQQQEAEVHVGLLLVEGHSSPYIQPYIKQERQQVHTSEEKVPSAAFKLILRAQHAD